MAEEELTMEGIMRLAQQLQGTPPPPVNTAAPDNELGLLGRLFGGSGASSGLSTEQQEMQARRAMMAFGSGLTEAATRPLPYGGQRSFMGGFGEGARAAFDTSAQFEKEARELAKERREEHRAQFKDRMDALGGASKLAEMQQSLRALRLRQQGLDEGGAPAPGAPGALGGGGGGGADAPQFTGDPVKDEAMIIQRESRGDPTALNYVARADPTAYERGATASGLHGFTNTTWREGLQMVGGDAGKYPTARSAPPELQKQVFTAVYKARGTRPWDPTQWGQNWVKGADGKYTLVATPRGGGGGERTPPPYRVAARDTPPPPGQTPPAAVTPATPPPATPPGVTPPATPQATPPAEPALPEEQARARARETGRPVPMLGANGQPTGLSVMPDGNMANTPPAGAQPAAAVVTPPADLPPGVQDYQTYRQTNLRQPSPEERRLFGGDLTPEDKQGIQAERGQLEQALRNAQTAYRQGTGESGAIVAARTKLAEHEGKVREAAATARAKGREVEAKWWENQETQLRTAHGKLVEDTRKHRDAIELETLRAGNKRQENVDTAVTGAASERVKDLQARASVAQRMIRNVEALEAFAPAMGDPNALVASNPQLRDWLITLGLPGLAGGTMGELRASQVWDRLVTSFGADVKVPGSGSTSDKEGEWMLQQFGGPEQTIEDRMTQLAVLRKLSQNRIADHTDAADMFQNQNGKLSGLDKKIAERSKLFDRPPAWKPEDGSNLKAQGRYMMRHPRGEPYAAYNTNGELRYYRNELVNGRLEPRPLLGGNMVAE